MAMKSVIISKFVRQNRIGKACALVAATLILPILAHAQTNPNGTTQNGTTQNGTKQNSVPDEVNTAWLLVPVLGGLLLYSWRRRSKAKA